MISDEAVKRAAAELARKYGEPKKIAEESARAAPSRSAETRIQEKRTNPNRAENEFMMNLMILRNTLYKNGPAVKERAKRAGKWVWRDIQVMTRLVEKVQDALVETMPPAREDYYRTYARNGHYELKMNGPIRGTRLVLIGDRNLGAICDAAMENECILCIREGKEIEDCLLRKALLEAAPPTVLQEEGRVGRCEYRETAGQLLRGEEVTV